MIKTKAIWICAFALSAGCARVLMAEEQNSVLDALSSTTLSGFVDTSASWWVGTQNADGLPGRTFGPANDDLIAAEIVTAGHVFAPTNLTEATLELGEPVRTQQSGSVWYKWNVNQNGFARISTAAIAPMPIPAASSTMPALSDESIFYPWGGISYDGSGGNVGGVISTYLPPIEPFLIGYYRWWTYLAVYRAVPVTETEMSFEFVDRGNSLEFEARAGETFWVGIEVYEREPDFEGQPELPSPLPSELNFDLTPPPANDSFASSLSVADSAGGTMTGYALAATREPGEPDLGDEYGGGSVWFHYTAATYGTVVMSDVSRNLPIAVFTGNAVSDLKLVAKSSAGGIGFFGEEGKIYHIAVYRGVNTADFNLTFHGPRYRRYETNVDGLIPNGLAPHFYGVRGVTMLFYAKTTTGWDLVEVEPIVNQAADLLIQPSGVVDGQLRVITIDEALPLPRVILSTADRLLNVNLAGIPGQTCGVSYSTDLLQWSPARIITLKSAEAFVHSFDPAGSNYFFRVTRFAPRPPVTPPPIPTQ